MIKFEPKHRRITALVIAFALIAFGLLQQFNVLHFDEKISSQVTFVLFVAAAAMIFSSRRSERNANVNENTNSKESTDLKEDTDVKENTDSNQENDSPDKDK